MPIKRAFTLIEITIVILLVGVLYSLVLSNYNKKKPLKSQSIEDVPSFIVSNNYLNGKFYIYGKFCQKGVFIDTKGKLHKTPNFNYPKNSLVLKKSMFDKFTIVKFQDIRIDKKSTNVCLVLPYKNGRFSKKEIVEDKNIYYLFAPFWQKIKRFNSLEKAKERYLNSTLYPQNRDDYYYE